MSKLVPGVVVFVAGARFALTGIHQLSDIEGWQDAAGVVGIALAALAVYAATALALEDAQGRTVLPLGRRRTGRRSVEDPMSSQLDGVENEAGVRKLL